jgi:hypothetical protein
MACPIAGTCALHASISMKEALRVWQSFYCEGCHSRCERFKLAASGLDVPPRLLPNGRLLDAPEASPRAEVP